MMEGRAERYERELTLIETMAWRTAELITRGYHKPRKFTDLRRFLTFRPKRRQLTTREMQSRIMAYVRQSGGKVIEKDGR